MRPPSHPIAQVPLRLLARLYGAVVRARNRRFDRPGLVQRVGAPVVSVGNLTVGGTGKTPLVAWLASRMQLDGRRPAIVSRGYAGRAGRGPLTVSAGDGPCCPPELCGDEPWLLASSLPGVRVVVGSDRPAAARSAVSAGADVVILDDGFQHRRLARDLDLVLLDASDPFGGGRLLPAGRLREPLDSLRRADVVLVTRNPDPPGLSEIESVVRRHQPTAPVLGAGYRRIGFFDRQGQQRAAPTRAVAFCGIGSPEPFPRDLRAEGVTVVSFRVFRDHHAYSRAEIEALREIARREDAELVTTEKDLVRLSPVLRDGDPEIFCLRIAAEVFRPRPLLERLRVALAEGTR